MGFAYWGVVVLFLAGGISYAFQPRRFKGEKPRLNMWLRAAIVLTLLWMPTGYLWESEIEQAAHMESFDGVYTHCRDEQDQMLAIVPNPDWRQCSNQGQAWLHFLSLNDEERKQEAAFVPVVLGWILAFAFLWITRWVLAGRRKATA